MLPSEYIELGWCQGYRALDKNNKEIEPNSKKAISWCMIGACIASYKYGSIKYIQLHDLQYCIKNIIKDNAIFAIPRYNDDKYRTKEQVMNIMKQAENELGLQK